jgi:hypothetical protein
MANVRFNKILVDKRGHSRLIGAIFYPQEFITPIATIIVGIILSI